MKAVGVTGRLARKRIEILARINLIGVQSRDYVVPRAAERRGIEDDGEICIVAGNAAGVGSRTTSIPESLAVARDTPDAFRFAFEC
jgi:hypothetical protein